MFERLRWPLTFLALTVALYYLHAIDRTSVPAMYVVEWGQAAGSPLYMLALLPLIASTAWVIYGIATTPTPAPIRRGTLMEAPARPRPLPILDMTGDPRQDTRLAAESLDVGPCGTIRFDEARDLPYTLRLRQATPEQARKRMDQYFAFLSRIATPPKGRVTLESCPDLTEHHHLVAARARNYFAEEAFYVMAHGGSVDIVFSQPDPRWGAKR